MVKKTKKKTQNLNLYFCVNCKGKFYQYSSLIKTDNPSCSRSCARKFQQKTPYIRTSEHKQKMSSIIKNHPTIEAKSQRFIVMNKTRKGQTFQEIYGKEKAQQLLSFYSERVMGKKNFNYVDGRSYYPYPIQFNKFLKEKIKKLDGRLCARCCLSEEKAKQNDTLSRGLTIHHIDFNKNNCGMDNLITACKSCNVWANFHRNESIILFQSSLRKREIYGIK
ncbi:MAG: HNH endonuclease [Nanoarchaeota archaeon]